jgi:hypothetical protein
MKVDYIPEPELEFGTDRHIDIRFGLMNHRPLDYESEFAPKQINLGIVGTSETVEGVQEWLEECRVGIAAKKSNQPNLFPRFPGFGPDTKLQAALLTNSQLQQTIPQREFDALCKNKLSSQTIRQAVDLFIEELARIAENPVVDVLMCALPMSLLDYMEQEGTPDESDDEEEGEGEEESKIIYDFHHLLKAKGMSLSKPTQLILPMTYDKTKKRSQKRHADRPRRLQDEATRAWNLYTALYYKAGGAPWRLLRDPTQHAACYVGVSFYKTLEEAKMMTSTAQVFNERGEGVICRGGKAVISADDKQPHLQAEDAYELLNRALNAYKGVHRNFPARIVLQKTSGYNAAELEGFKKALSAHGIDLVDFITVRKSFTRLFRNGEYPTLRGTLLSLDDQSHVLYTRGSVNFFATYPGKYVPRPLSFFCQETEQTPKFLAQEILALTKMNWNNTQFDNGDPIIVKAARKVGDVLKYVGENDPIQPRYSYYM